MACVRSVVSRDRLQVRASPAKGRADIGFPLQSLLTRLPEVVVHGIPTVQRAVINRQTDGRFQLYAEGTDLRVRRARATRCGNQK